MNKRRKKSTSTLGGFLASAVVLSGFVVAGPASADALPGATPSARALASLRSTLAAEAATGAAEARANLERFTALSASDEADLGDYLIGKTDVSTAGPKTVSPPVASGPRVVREGRAEWKSSGEVVTVTPVGDLRAAQYNVHSYADETFSFLGIQLTRTRVWGDYVTGSGKVLKTTGRGSQVIKNYQPMTDISTVDYAPQLSDGKALFRAKIIVKRGPAPGLGGNWSTKEGIQYFRASGPGVYAHGWM